MEYCFPVSCHTFGQRHHAATLPAVPRRLEGRRGEFGPGLTPARPVWAEQAQGVKLVRETTSPLLYRRERECSTAMRLKLDGVIVSVGTSVSVRLVCGFGSSVGIVTVVGGIYRRRWTWIAGQSLDGVLDSVGPRLSVRLVCRFGSTVGIVTVVGGIYRRRWTKVVDRLPLVVGYWLAVGDWR